jgi:hypothetical protein
MNPLARRSPRILLVAAVSTTAWVGSTTGASALMRCDPTISDCPDEVVGFTTVKTPHVTTIQTVTEKTIIRNSFVDKSLIIRERTRTFEFDPHVVVMPDGTTRWCDDLTTEQWATRTAAKPAEQSSVQAAESAPVTTAAVRTAPAATAVQTPKAAHKPKAVPKKAVQEKEVPKKAAVTTTSAPAPEAVVTEALPRTGGDGAVLTMLGLALIASGAAMRTVARD